MKRLVVAASIAALAAVPVYAAAQSRAVISNLHKAHSAAEIAADTAAVNNASRTSLFVLSASRLATTKGSTQGVRDIAQAAIRYHTQGLSDIRASAAAADIRLPPLRLTAEQTAKLAALEAASGAAFDTLYMNESLAAQEATARALLAHGAGKGNLIVRTQCTRQGNQIMNLVNAAKAGRADSSGMAGAGRAAAPARAGAAAPARAGTPPGR